MSESLRYGCGAIILRQPLQPTADLETAELNSIAFYGTKAIQLTLDNQIQDIAKEHPLGRQGERAGVGTLAAPQP